jgi:hypothetical protein
VGALSLKMSNADVDPRLLTWAKTAAEQSPYDVVIYSGKREGDPRFHGKGQAIDINLVDPKTGRVLSNYQKPEDFAAFQSFANGMRAAQMASNPEAAKQLRWGGYFSGGKGKYGAFDLMHFDTGGDTVGMGGGSWEGGLTPEQAKTWGLTPGGGFTGNTAAPGAATPTPAADVIAPAAKPKSMRDTAASAFSGINTGPQGGGEAGVSGQGGMPTVDFQAEPAGFSADALGQPWDAGAKQTYRAPEELADLFKVKDIGKAGTATLPGRRF